MKVFKIILSIILVLIVIFVAAIFIIISTIDIKKYKPQIVEQATSALGREVQIGDIDLALSMRQGITLNIQSLSIADNPAFSLEPMVTIQRVGLDVNILAFLTERKIVVTRANVQAPQINVIRNAAGQINVSELGQSKPTAAAPNAAVTPAASQEPSSAAASSQQVSIPEFIVRSILVQNATARYRDPAMALDVSDIDLKVTDFSLSRPFKFTLQMSVLGDRQNMQVEGSGKVSLAEAKFESQDIRMSFDLSHLSLAKLNQSLPMVKGLLKEGSALKGKGRVVVTRLSAGANGLEQLAAAVQFSEGRAAVVQLPKDIENINLTAEVTQEDALVKQASLQYAGGVIAAQGQILDYLKTQRFDGSVAIQKVPVADLIPPQQQAIKVQGAINGKYAIKGAGFALDSMLKTLAGEGGVDVLNGEIVDMNILRMALEKMSMIPQLVERVSAALPPEYKEILERKNTIIKTAKTDTKIADGLITIREAVLETDGFLVLAEGSVGLDQSVNLAASLFIEKGLSAGMIAGVEELKYFLEDDGRIRIPLKSYSGGLADLKVMPDLEYLGKKIIKNRGKEEIQRLLNRAIGGDDEESHQPQDSTQPNSSQQPARPEQEMIGNILDAIFK